MRSNRRTFEVEKSGYSGSVNSGRSPKSVLIRSKGQLHPQEEGVAIGADNIT